MGAVGVVLLAAPPGPVVPVVVAPAGADPTAALLETLLSGPLTVSALAGIALPLVTGLVTGRTWPPTVKGLMLAALSFFAAVVAEFVARESSGREVDWRTVLTAALVTWVTAQVAHQGVWRHTALSQLLQRVGLPRLPAPAPARDPDAPPWGSADHVDLGGRSVTATIRRATTQQQPGEARVPRDPARAARARRDLTPPRPVLPPEPARLPRPAAGRRERDGPRTLDDR